jgi:hypothetical protein
MIEKVPGNSKINKLRVIHLYEADYNLLLKIIWAWRLVWHAHDYDRINEGQAGSRPGRNSIDVVIQKGMKYLFSSLAHTGMATMENDAKSCYDRIICNLAMIISQYYGLSPETVNAHGTTLKSMKYRLRTALGDSRQYYYHTQSSPIHGTGKGSCASPALWLLISSTLMHCLAELAGGMTMADAVDQEKTLIQWIDGFMEDTSLFTNLNSFAKNCNDIVLLTEALKRDLIAWKELLEATGGKLELKNFFTTSWHGDSMEKEMQFQRR